MVDRYGPVDAARDCLRRIGARHEVPPVLAGDHRGADAFRLPDWNGSAEHRGEPAHALDRGMGTHQHRRVHGVAPGALGPPASPPRPAVYRTTELKAASKSADRRRTPATSTPRSPSR